MTTETEAMRRLIKRSTKDLRAAWEKRTGKSGDGATRDWLIRDLARQEAAQPETTTTKTAQPTDAEPAPEAAPDKERTTMAKTTKTAKPKAEKKPKAPPKPKAERTPRPQPAGLPDVGGKITKTYKGKEITVTVLADGFRYDGETFSSLTAIALKITGYPAISGPFFFGIKGRGRATP